MTMRSTSKGYLTALLVAALTLPGLAGAQDLPSGEELMDKSSAASGGDAVLEDLENVTVRGKMTIQNMGMSGDVAMYMARPDRAYMVFELPGLEKLQRGWNGEVGWETSIMQGPRLLAGSELASFLRDVDFEAQLDWRRMYKSAECTGESEVDGRPCYVVELMTQTDEEMTMMLDKETFLPAAMKVTAETQYGSITADITFKEYKNFKGMTMPVITETVAAGQTMVLTIDKVALNEEIDESLFAIPADVQALIDKESGTEESP